MIIFKTDVAQLVYLYHRKAGSQKYFMRERVSDHRHCTESRPSLTWSLVPHLPGVSSLTYPESRRLAYLFVRS